MVDRVNGTNLNRISPADLGRKPAGSATEAGGRDFKQVLMDSISEVNRLQQEANAATEQLMTGQNQNVAEVFSAVKKADVAFSLLMQIRNQLTEAYSEIRNMRL